MKRLSHAQFIRDYLLSVLDMVRIKLPPFLPKTNRGAAAMGRRAGIFLNRKNPWFPNRQNGITTVVNFNLESPVRIYLNPHLMGWKASGILLEGRAHYWQEAYGKAIWDYHISTDSCSFVAPIT